MTFMMNNAYFYYMVMPFGLENVGATYKRLMDNVFRGLIIRNVEVNVDCIVLKFESCDRIVEDLKEDFVELKKNNMRLNFKSVFSG